MRMSKAASAVIDRTMRDEEFLDHFQRDPDAALEEYNLTEQEIEALKSGDGSQIRESIDDTIGDGLYGFIYPPPK